MADKITLIHMVTKKKTMLGKNKHITGVFCSFCEEYKDIIYHKNIGSHCICDDCVKEALEAIK